MPTRTTPRLKKSPDTNDRHLQAVPDLTPSLGERVDARIRDNGGDPRKVRRAGKVAGLLLAAGLASGALAVSVLPAGSKDARTELHQDQERNLMDAFLTSGKTEMRVGNAEVTRLAGSIRITPDPTEHVNMRSTLARQNFDPRNPGENWDSNADVQVGYNFDTKRDNFVELVDPVQVTYDNGDTYVGGLMADDEGNVPEVNSPEDFAKHASWAFISELQKPYSGASVEIVPSDAQPTAVVLGQDSPVVYIAHTKTDSDGNMHTVYGG